jgi:hypothetical protein
MCHSGDGSHRPVYAPVITGPAGFLCIRFVSTFDENQNRIAVTFLPQVRPN